MKIKIYSILNYLGILTTFLFMYAAVWYWSWQYFWTAAITAVGWVFYASFMLDKLKVKPHKLFMVPKDHIIGGQNG